MTDEDKVELYYLEKRLRNAERILERFGYHPCNLQACNCDSYHIDERIAVWTDWEKSVSENPPKRVL
jgi:hypothetical protein